jgi:hypothetical protein
LKEISWAALDAKQGKEGRKEGRKEERKKVSKKLQEGR